MVIIDEAHKGNFKAVFDIWPDAFYVGATATPIATSKKDPLKNYYQDIAYKFDVAELIEMGFLVGVHPFKMMAIDNEKLVKSYSKGDFTEKSQYDEFSKPTVFAGLLKAWRKHASDKKTIVFCVNIQHTLDTVRDFQAAGYSAVYITSKSTPEERRNALADFHSGNAQIMVNCGILTTGYDHPPIECVVMNRATMSLALWLQCCGRGSRISTGKDEYTLIDMGGNIDRLGQWDDERDWRDWFFNPQKPGQSQPAPVKECPECESLISARSMMCKFCEYEFPEPEQTAETIEGKLIEARKAPEHLKGRKLDSLNTSELYELYQSQRYKKGLILRVIRARGEPELKRFAQVAKFKSGWVYYQSTQDTTYTNITIR
jgi:superfamily II DNA or RNA helicase